MGTLGLRGTLRHPDGPPRRSRWRRVLLVTAIALPVVLAGAGAGGWFWLQAKVERSVQERLERVGERLRRNVTAGSIEVDLHASVVRLRDVALAPRGEGRFSVHIDEIDLSFDRWAAARGARSAAVTRVAFGAIDVSVPAAAGEPALAALTRAAELEVAAFAGPSPPSQGGSTMRELPELSVSSVSVVIDRGGTRETLMSGGMDLDLSATGRTRVALKGRPSGGPEVAVSLDLGRTLADCSVAVEPDAPLLLPAPYPVTVRRVSVAGRTVHAEGVHAELPDVILDAKTAQATAAGAGRPERPIAVELGGVAVTLRGKRGTGELRAGVVTGVLTDEGLTSKASELAFDLVLPGLGALKGGAGSAVAEIGSDHDRLDLTLHGATLATRRAGVTAEGSARVVHVTANIADAPQLESADADIVVARVTLASTFEALRAGAAEPATASGATGVAGSPSLLRGARLAVTDAALTVTDAAGAKLAFDGLAAHLTSGLREPHLRTSGRVTLPDGSPHKFSVEGDLDPQAEVLELSVMATDLPLGHLLAPRLPSWRIPDAMRADIDLRVVLDRARRLGTATGRVAVRDAGFYHRRLAEEAVAGVSVVADGLTLIGSLGDEPAFALDVPHLRVGPADVELGVLVSRWGKSPLIQVGLRFPRQPCQSFASAIPRAILGPLGDMRLGGKMAFSARLSLDFERPDSSLLALTGDIDDCWPETLGSDADGKLQKIREGSFVREWPDDVRVGPGTGGFVRLDEMPPYVPGAALMTEDGLFYSHHGFRLASINRSLKRTVAKRRFWVGGSTITQQLAKNVFLDRQKILARKIREAILAWNLERTFGKDTLLELYLNIIEYGPGIYGISNGAQFYFGKSVSDLTPLEAAFLMGLKPQPKWGYSIWRKNKTSENWKRLLRAILERMARRGFIPPEAVDELAPYELTFRRP